MPQVVPATAGPQPTLDPAADMQRNNITQALIQNAAPPPQLPPLSQQIGQRPPVMGMPQTPPQGAPPMGAPLPQGMPPAMPLSAGVPPMPMQAAGVPQRGY